MTEHLSDTVLIRLAAETPPPDDLADAWRHLQACEQCQRRTFLHPQHRVDFVEQPQDKYNQVVDRVFTAVLDENRELEGGRSRAAALFAELEHHTFDQQKLLIANSPKYRSWAVVEQLLAACRKSWSEDPKRAEGHGQLALHVIDHLHLKGFRENLLADLKAEAWAYVGNCRRIQSDLAGAAEAFSHAETSLSLGTADSIERARLLDLKASYLIAAGRYEAAASSLETAIRCYDQCADRYREGRAYLKYAKVLYESGDLERAIGALDRATRLTDEKQDPYLAFLLKWTAIIYLTELDRTAEAWALLPEVREVARARAPRLDRLRFLWTEALLRKKMGQAELAESAFLQVREGFIAAGIASDVALVSLDLAGFYLEDGRTAEVRRLAAEAAPIFASRGIEREVLMAWSLFCQAAERDAATIELVGRVSDRIRRAAQR